MALPKGARRKFPRFTATEGNPLEIVAKVRVGLPYSEFTEFQRSSGLTIERFAKITGLSKSSLLRRRGKKLTPKESEALVRLERLYALAVDVFEDVEIARSWLQRANPALEWKSPLEFVDTDVGARQVEHLMGQIEHGVA